MFKDEAIIEIQLRKSAWEERNSGKKNDNRFKTDSNIIVKSLYTPLDLDVEKFDYMKYLGFPGDFPYTRGIDPFMYRDNPWVLGEYSGFGTARETNRRYRYLLEQGASGLSIALDLPTQMGLDSDHPLSHGEVGKVGVAIDSIRDMEILFQDISLDQVGQISVTAYSIGPIMLGMFIVLCEKKGIQPSKLSIRLSNDPLHEFIARGTYIFPPEDHLRLSVDVVDYCTQYLQSWLPIKFNGYSIREAGGTAIQESAFMICNAIAYVEACLRRGLEIDNFAPQLTFFLSANIDFFEEVAKFRSLRRIWSKLMIDRFKAQDSKSMRARISAFTAGSNLTRVQIQNNITRVALEALAAVLGGVQYLYTVSMDEAISLPSEDAVTTALRTQQVIAYESGVTRTADPLGGSFFIETLTSEIEEKVKEYIRKIDKMGGAIEAIKAGFFQKEISESAYRYQRNIENQDKIVVGINKFKDDRQVPRSNFGKDPKGEEKQIEELKSFKRERDQHEAAKALFAVKEAAGAKSNVVPSVIEAIRNYATVGEICNSMKMVFGEYRDKGLL
jgi:methylmalonyl-CoA mutase N-terminal domain/subunit